MRSALDVAKYIIFHESIQGRLVSNLRLQKLLYFVQAQCLVSNQTPCFNDTIEAWNFGPVVPSVYHQYKLFGSSSIPCFENNQYSFHLIDSNTRVLIDNILDGCARYSASQLVEITHSQKPWIEAYSRSYNNEISQRAIMEFFGE